jgi:hypothetical protein
VRATAFLRPPNSHTRGDGQPLRISGRESLTKIVVCCSVAIGTFDAVDLQQLDRSERPRDRYDSSLRAKIPEAFLRGCGVPVVLIEYLPSLINSMEGIQFHSVFISYSHRDEEFAKRLHHALQWKGVRSWYAPHDLPIGARIRPAIDSSIHIYAAMMDQSQPTESSAGWLGVLHRREGRRVFSKPRFSEFLWVSWLRVLLMLVLSGSSD